MQGNKTIQLVVGLIMVFVPVFCSAGTYTVPCTDPFAFPLQAGWPIEVYGELDRSCVIADVDSDGKQEICFYPGYSGKTYLINHVGSDYNQHWPQELGSFVPSLTDVERDGFLEIFLGAYSPRLTNLQGEIIGEWPFQLNNKVVGIAAAPLITSIDKSGIQHILSCLDSDDEIYNWSYDGVVAENWPQNYGPSYYSPALVDLDKDGMNELIFNFTSSLTTNAGVIKIYKANGSIAMHGLWNFDLKINCGIQKSFESDVTVADVDGDSFPELMVAYQRGAVVINHDTTLAAGFPKDLHSNVYGGLTCGDIDGDDRLEIACVTSGAYDLNRQYKSVIYVWNGEDGTDLPNWPKDLINLDCGAQNVVIGDIDGDCDREVIVQAWHQIEGYTDILAYHHTGEIVSGFPLRINGFANLGYQTCFITDLDGDGDVEIGIGLDDGSNRTRIYIWDLPYAYHSECQDWPQYNHDYQHTGNYHFTPLPPLTVPGLTPLALIFLLLLLSPLLRRHP